MAIIRIVAWTKQTVLCNACGLKKPNAEDYCCTRSQAGVRLALDELITLDLNNKLLGLYQKRRYDRPWKEAFMEHIAEVESRVAEMRAQGLDLGLWY